MARTTIFGERIPNDRVYRLWYSRHSLCVTLKLFANTYTRFAHAYVICKMRSGKKNNNPSPDSRETKINMNAESCIFGVKEETHKITPDTRWWYIVKTKNPNEARIFSFSLAGDRTRSTRYRYNFGCDANGAPLSLPMPWSCSCCATAHTSRTYYSIRFR